MHRFQHPSLRSLSGLLFAAALPLTVLAEMTSAPAEQLLRSSRPLVIAHRGYSAVAPENTLHAFERALAAGADLIELDYHHTRDGALVVLHDFTLDRTTDATNCWGGQKLKVADRTFAELRGLDAGLWFQPPHPGVRLPTLPEALDVIQHGGVTLIERKAGDAATCVKLLRERSLINRVVVQAFDWAYLREFHALEPSQVLGALGPPSTRNGRKLTEEEKPLGPQWLDEIKAVGARVAVWNRQVDTTAVKAAHERGLKLWVYTINEEALARDLLGLGVDGLITDNTAIAWKAIAVTTLKH
jgi:glycerophosphoryl diester phosphodiesterase